MNITLIGAGNVGYHLAKVFYKKGIYIKQVYSRNIKNAKALSKKVNAAYTNDLSTINTKSDLYIIAVKDDAIITVAKQLSQLKGLREKLIVHTSGALESSILAPYFKNYGIFYPLQSFSKNKKIKFAKVPICIEANTDMAKSELQQLAGRISKMVSIITDNERAILHVMAVIVNNFTNHLFHLAHQVLELEKIDFALLLPLIQETVLKIEKNTPFEMQTGPARRNDEKTIQKHLEYLQKFPEYAQIYALLTKSIQHAYRR